LHQTSLQLRFLVLHRLIFLAAIVLLLAGCASGLGDTSSSQSADTVPGEKVQDDRFVPAASPGASGKVHW
jgi:PBP1b-binding outer membrane lipoprotein LpoB